MSEAADPSDDTVTPTGFAVEVPGFQGPFRLLADLILEQKLDVCDVPIASVTDGYLRYAKQTDTWNIEEATWFLAICAVLLELKIARLTPKHTELDEEDMLGASPDLAYARSIELHAFRKVALELARRLEDEAGFFTRDVGPGPEYAHLYPDPMDKVTAEQLRTIAAQLLRPPPTLDLSHVTPIRFTVSDAITTVEARLRGLEAGQATFRQLTADCEDRMEKVVRFLALLELYRDGKIELLQAATFGEIEVEWRG
jgi:segregation and condensation protein A